MVKHSESLAPLDVHEVLQQQTLIYIHDAAYGYICKSIDDAGGDE